MTNREMIIYGLQNPEYESLAFVTSYIACPYVSDDDCKNPYHYGTSDFQIYCDEQCKAEWLDKEF